jgi:hypothetical protein
MSYDCLSPEQQGVVDAMMDDCGSVKALAIKFHCKERSMKERLMRIYNHYGIDRGPFVPMIRLAYLRAKELSLLAICLFIFGALAQAQAATRPVVLTWTASTSTTVTGYAVFRCAPVSPNTSCTPVTTGTPLASVSGTTYTDTPNTIATYGYSVVAVAPACTPTTPNTTPCGQGAAVTLTAVPVPPQTAGATNIIVVVP